MKDRAVNPSGEVGLLINTPLGKQSQYDDYAMRRAAITWRRTVVFVGRRWASAR